MIRIQFCHRGSFYVVEYYEKTAVIFDDFGYVCQLNDVPNVDEAIARFRANEAA